MSQRNKMFGRWRKRISVFLSSLILSTLGLGIACTLVRGEEERAAEEKSEKEAPSPNSPKEAEGEKRVRVLFQQGLSALQQQDYSAALPLFSEIIRTSTSDSFREEAHLGRGEAYFARRSFQEAWEDWSHVFHLRREKGGEISPPLRVRLGACLYALQRYEEAIAMLLSLTEADLPSPIRNAAAYYLARAYQNSGRSPQAIPLLRSLQEREFAPLALLVLAEGYTFSRGSFAKAHVFRLFCQTYPFHRWVPQARLRESEELLTSLPSFCQLELNSPDEKTKEEAILSQAICYYRLRQYANMSACFQRLVEQFPASPALAEALYWLAWYASREKQWDKAIALYERLLERDPLHPLADSARYRRAICLYRNEQNQKAANALREILLHHPATPVDERMLVWLADFLLHKTPFPETETEALYRTMECRRLSSKTRLFLYDRHACLKTRLQDWRGALFLYHSMLEFIAFLRGREEKDSLYRIEERIALLGKAAALRELGQLREARAIVDSLSTPAGDPLTFRIFLEKGLLDLAEHRWASAAGYLLWVGLLSSHADLAGAALYRAGEACLHQRDLRKARFCLEELAGIPTESFGRRYPDSPWTAQGRATLHRIFPQRTPGEPSGGRP